MDASDLTFDYFDVSDDREAWRASAPTDELAHALIHAGFAPLGCALAVLSKRKSILLDQIWIARTGRVMAAVGRSGVELATLFEDGTIVKTSYQTLRAALNPAWWHLRKHPAARHFHATYDATVDDLLARQESRVKEIEADGGVVVPATSMQAHFAMRLRTADLRIARQLVEVHVILAATMVLSVLVGVGAVFARLATHGRHGRAEQPLLLLLGLAATIIAIAPLHRVAQLGSAPFMSLFVRGPRPQPASELFARAESVQRGDFRAIVGR